jgi:hypothetical protein
MLLPQSHLVIGLLSYTILWIGRDGRSLPLSMYLHAELYNKEMR